MQYPFKPKSTSSLKKGQYWTITRSDDKFACGIVLDTIQNSRTHFLAGLFDWVGFTEPTNELISGKPIIHQGQVHIKTILEYNEYLTGELSPSNVPLPLLCVEHLGAEQWGLFQGLELLKTISQEEAKNYPAKSTWGYSTINIRAEKIS
ncbi:MAG: hypothetical protein KDJ50_04875 [Alphaproteobacteria bacterium]|nr:hypothetical protein [Alphaproteobacteria bacterium]